MRRLGFLAPAQQTRRAANAGGGVIRASVPEGQGGAMRSLGSAVAGTSPDLPMG